MWIHVAPRVPRSHGHHCGCGSQPHVCLASRRRRRLLGLQLLGAAGNGRCHEQGRPNWSDGTLGRWQMWLCITYAFLSTLSTCVNASLRFTFLLWVLVFFHVHFSNAVAVWAESESIHVYCSCDGVWHYWGQARLRLAFLHAPEYTRISPFQHQVDLSDGACARVLFAGFISLWWKCLPVS